MAETNNNSLMKKTKAQLLDIILRKDDVEVKLRKQIEVLNKEIENNKHAIANYENSISSLKETIADNNIVIEKQKDAIESQERIIDEFKDTCDENATKIIELTDKFKKENKNLSVLFLILFLMMLAFIIII